MNTSEIFYTTKLYPLQDKVLQHLSEIKLKHYLTGGTAISRFNFQHRYSDDLDFFLNQDKEFESEVNRAIEKLKKEFSEIIIERTEEAFARIFVVNGDVELKIEFVNDVGYHEGGIESFPLYHKVDNLKNILSNKLCAISRRAEKDIVDLIWLCRNLKFNWKEAIEGAMKKDTWVNETDLFFALETFPMEKILTEVKWIEVPDEDILKNDLKIILGNLIKATDNSLCKK